MRRKPVMRTLAAALLTGGVIAGMGVAASPASAATTNGAVSLSPNTPTGSGCGFGVGFNRGFNSNCGGFGFGNSFGYGGFGGFAGFGGYGFNSTPVVIIVS